MLLIVENTIFGKHWYAVSEKKQNIIHVNNNYITYYTGSTLQKEELIWKNNLVCSTVVLCWFIYFIYINVYMLNPTPASNLAIPPSPFGNHKLVFYVCECIYAL